jgi:hypothetical protein
LGSNNDSDKQVDDGVAGENEEQRLEVWSPKKTQAHAREKDDTLCEINNSKMKAFVLDEENRPHDLEQDKTCDGHSKIVRILRKGWAIKKSRYLLATQDDCNVA